MSETRFIDSTVLGAFGLAYRRGLHLTLAVIFAILWTGTFVTGVFFLPHDGLSKEVSP